MEYEADDSNIEYMIKVEALMKQTDLPFRDRQMIFDKHKELKKTVDNQIMNSGWKKLYKFITDSVQDQRLQNHITESIGKIS